MFNKIVCATLQYAPAHFSKFCGCEITFYHFTMQHRKIKGTKIFNGNNFEESNNVLVVTDDGTVITLINEYEAGENVETYVGIICPGFINAHCHIELSHLKNKIPQHTGLVNFVQQVMVGRTATEQEKEDAMLLAETELINSGTVAVGDICNTADSISLKNNSTIYWHNFIEVSGFVDAAASQRFEAAYLISKEFEYSTQKKQIIVPHAPYSVSKTLFKILNEKSQNAVISIHNQECEAEDALYFLKEGGFLELYKNFGINLESFAATGKTSLQSWLPYFNKNQKIISVHNTFISEEDLIFAQHFYNKEKLVFCLCPNANLYIENKLPPLELLMAQNCNIVLGTDSYASNRTLNMFEEIKTISLHFPTIALETILKWATINGAKALEIDNVFGSFEKGKKPGVVLIGEDRASRIL